MSYTIGVFASLFDEEGKVVLVKQSYAGQCWTQPGGGLEEGEDPVTGLLREIAEETAIRARVDGYVGTYVSPYRSDVVLHFRCAVIAREAWKQTPEIVECGFFDPGALPEPMRPHTRSRIEDGLRMRSNVFRVLVSSTAGFDVTGR